MCGIYGIAKFNDEQVSQQEVVQSIKLLTHRGPDDQGVYVKGSYGIGHRRLSIIDLAGGQQPIHNEDKTVWLSFNGEIYNYKELSQELKSDGHRFYTKSDSEVIVHLYEKYQEDCVKYLNGIFAFVLYDEKKQKFFLARDHLGVKPLFYYHHHNRFICSSEIKSIVQNADVKRELNPQAFYHFLSLNYVPHPLTMFENIYSLAPGHSLLLQDQKITITKYFNLRFNPDLQTTEKQYALQLKERLTASVNQQMVSDVPVGAFLSGGLDSSLMVHLMSAHSPQKLKTFNVGFNEKSYDESSYAKLVADYYQTEHHQVVCTPYDYLASIDDIINKADNLTVDVSMLSLYMVSKLASEHVKVVLSGDGADELFAGYPTYQADRVLKMYQRLPGAIKNRLIPYVVNQLPVDDKKMSFQFKARRFMKGSALSAQEAHYSWRTIFYDQQKQQLLDPSFLNASWDNTFSVYQECYRQTQDLDDLSQHLNADLNVWMVDSILAKVDSMSMAHSLEVRVPFLDPDLVSFAATIPSYLKLRGMTSKYILRKAMKLTLPAKILNRKKAGFNIPFALWLRNELKGFMLETLSERNIKDIGFLNGRFVQQLIDEHLKCQADHSFQLLNLIHFFLWYNHFLSPVDAVT